MTSSYGSGLICGFRLATPQLLDDEVPGIAKGEPRWLHFNLSDSRGRAWIKGQDDLPEEARELLLDHDARVRVEVLPAHLNPAGLSFRRWAAWGSGLRPQLDSLPRRPLQPPGTRSDSYGYSSTISRAVGRMASFEFERCSLREEVRNH